MAVVDLTVKPGTALGCNCSAEHACVQRVCATMCWKRRHDKSDTQPSDVVGLRQNITERTC
eukprot:15452499-Alexandrium_andersonii.AAC.1